MSRTQRWTVLSLIPIVIFVALLYMRAMPLFEAADEAAHFLYIHNLLETGELPRIASRAQIATQTEQTKLWAIESHQPPLYYALGALLVSGIDRSDVDHYLRSNSVIFVRGITEHNHNKWLHEVGEPEGDTATAIMLLRMYSLALSLGTLWFVYLTANELTHNNSLALLAALLVATMPTFLSIGSSINNDNLVTMLYAAGTFLSVKMLTRRQVTNADIVALAAVLSAIALTKITGLSLFAVVFAVLALGAWRGHWTTRRALTTVGIVVGVAVLVAGWWYVRNWTLYGDPLALGATRSIWGREFEIAATSGDAGAELLRILRSFYMMFGHLHNPVYGPLWTYVYFLTVVVLGWTGFGTYLTYQAKNQRDRWWLLLGICAVVVLMLLIGTRSVDISYGRLLFPALAAFATITAVGLWTALRRFAWLALLPLLVVVVGGPFTISHAYPQPEILQTTSDTPLNAFVIDSVEASGSLRPGETKDIQVTFHGQHDANPFLMVNVLDGLTLDAIGRTQVYPGMMPTDTLNPAQMHRVHMPVQVDAPVSNPARPHQVMLGLEWWLPGATEPLPINTRGAQLIPGPVLVHPQYRPLEPDHALDEVRFVGNAGEALRLRGYTVSETTVLPGESFDVTLHWAGGQAREDWTLTVQLLDANGRLVTQNDGPVEAYPTSRWLEDVAFDDTRTLTIPADTEPGAYGLLVGWYNTQTRMAISGTDAARDNLLMLQDAIIVRSGS